MVINIYGGMILFEPKFEYTNNLVNTLLEISAADAVINNTNLYKSYDLLFKDSAMVKSAYHSTSIAGNALTIKQANQLFNGEVVMADHRWIQEVQNYFNVLEKLEDYSETGLDEEIIARINRDLSMGTMKKTEISGKYRNSELKEYISEFLTWLKNTTNLHPVITAAIAHHVILSKLPFYEGNGKTARIMVYLAFKIQKFNVQGYYQVDEEFHKNIDSYKESILETRETGDLTKWIEYFAEMLLISILKIKDDVATVYREKCISHDVNQIPISPREIRIFQFLRTNKKIRSRDIQKMFGVSHHGVFKYIQKLLDSGVIKAMGKGRNTYYVFRN